MRMSRLLAALSAVVVGLGSRLDRDLPAEWVFARWLIEVTVNAERC